MALPPRRDQSIQIMRNSSVHAPARLGALALVIGLSSCAQFSADGGMDDVSRLTQARAGHAVALQRSQADNEAAQARITQRLGKPLDVEGAAEVALLGNRELQAQLAGLGVAEFDWVEAARLRNPELSLSRLAGGGALEIDRSIVVNLLDLLTKPSQGKVAELRFERARFEVAAAAVTTARRAQQAFYDAVAAAQLADYAQQVLDTADASRDLAQRMAEAGNLSRLDQLREQAFQAEAQAALTRRKQNALTARERLMRALGLAGAQVAALQLPDHLPDVPDTVPVPGEVEQVAMAQRLDIRSARLDAEAAARQLGLTEVTGYVNVLDVGWQNRSGHSIPAQRGVTVSVELPIFDVGGPARSKARAQYLAALNRAAAVATNARSQVREAQAATASAYALARHYRDEVLPLRQHIAEENLRRYNGMLIDVFALLADAREQIASVTASVEATHDFWAAQTRLQDAIDGAPNSAEDTPQ